MQNISVDFGFFHRKNENEITRDWTQTEKSEPINHNFNPNVNDKDPYRPVSNDRDSFRSFSNEIGTTWKTR